EYEHAQRDGVQFVWNTAPVSIRQDGIECRNRSGDLFYSCDMVITSIGQSKLFGALAEAKGIEIENGRVRVDAATGQTTNPRYFAGGDCVNGGREVVDAVAEGTRAGKAITARLGECHGRATVL